MARRLRPPVSLILLPIAAALAGCGGGGAAAGDGVEPPEREPATEIGRAHSFDVEPVAEGLNRPTWVGSAPGDTDRIWALEQPGRVVRIAADGSREVMLDMTAEVEVGGEQGLLGIAFNPDFAVDRRLYLHWSAADDDGATRVAELRARPDGTIDLGDRRMLLELDQPEANHNGGQLAFGLDGRLHLGLGDGGGSFDRDETAQDPDTLLGKVVSLDVEARRPRWRVELSGLRNPWRFAFDPALGELWVGDVGQDETEEVNRVLLESDEPPKNLGWSAFEGTYRIHETHALDPDGELVWPVAVYGHDDGCSITGGHVHRGAGLPRLAGRYLYGDFCSGTLWTLRPTPDGFATDVRRERARIPQLTSIGQDAAGDPLFASATGTVYRAVAPRR